jgi:hypothetical protein
MKSSRSDSSTKFNPFMDEAGLGKGDGSVEELRKSLMTGRFGWTYLKDDGLLFI